MGKHDKAVFSWEPSEGSFLEAENKKLKAELEEARHTIRVLERELDRMDRANDAVADKSCEVIIEKDAEIAMLNMKILKLVKDHV